MRFIETSSNANTFLAVFAVSFSVSLGILVLSMNFGYAYSFALAFAIPFGLLSIETILIYISKTKNLISRLCWWHILWLFMALSGLVIRIRDTGTIEENPLDPWALYRIGLMSLVAFVLLGRLAMGKTQWVISLSRGLVGLMAGYALVSVASTFWSIYPLWTLYKSVEYLIDVALIAAIVASMKSTLDCKTLFDWTWFLMGLLATTVWLGLLLWPEQAILHGVGLIGIQISGVLPALAANRVGDLGAFLGIIALTRLLFQPKHKRFYLIVLGGALVTLVLSQSRTPLTGFLTASTLVLFAARRIGILTLTMGLVVALLFMTGVDALFEQFFLRGQNPELFSSLTGRMDWWKTGWESFKERPYIGYGAYAGARFTVFSGASETTSHIHNVWLEVLLGVGVVGLTFIVGAFVCAWIVLLRFVYQIRNNDLLYRLALEAIGVLTIISVRTIFDSLFIIWHPPIDFLLVLGYAEFLRRNHREIVHESAAYT